MPRPLLTTSEAYPDPPGLDTAVSHAILRAVGTGARGETLRIHTTPPVVAFGRQDTTAPGYRAAVEAARSHGFEAVERLAGGRAAVFSEGTLAFSWAIPADDPRQHIHRRFQQLAEVMSTAFRSLGADARIGQVPGEYCPGSYSVNIGGRWKVMGVGQRLVRGAAHVGGVVVVTDADRIRRVLEPVYRALDVGWDPTTVGDLGSAIPGVSLDDVREAVLSQLATRQHLVPRPLEPEILDQARRLAASHVAPAA